MTDYIKLIGDVGLPIVAATAAGYLAFLALKFILASVTSSVKQCQVIILALDKRVAAMNNDIIKIDTKVSHALGLQPDLDRIARAEQSDQRRD